MNKISSTIASFALLATLASCDEGRLYDTDIVTEEEGGNARVTATISGESSWTSGYAIAVAGFESGNEYAIISKNVEVSASDGTCDVALTGIPAEVSTIELCALDRLRRRVATFATADYKVSGDTLRIDAGALDVSMANAIQQEIFNTTCIQCHGGSNYAAAGLHLTEGLSFESLVGVSSVKVPGKHRVEAGSSTESVMYEALAEGISSSWRYDHSVEVVKQEKLDLIRNWIDGGAKHN